MTTTPKNNADDKQVSGDHYKSESQHWNLLPALGYGHEYYTGQAVKYLSRWRKKNGVRDVLKAQHFIEKLIELVDEHGGAYLPCDILNEKAHREHIERAYKKHLFKFFDSNDIDRDTAAVCERGVLQRALRSPMLRCESIKSRSLTSVKAALRLMIHTPRILSRTRVRAQSISVKLHNTRCPSSSDHKHISSVAAQALFN